MSHSSKKAWRQNDERKLRRATDQALSGGHVRTVRSDRWSHTPEQPPLMDAPSNGTRKSTRGKCKRNKMGAHVVYYEPKAVRYGNTYFGQHRCLKCGKHMWGWKGPVVTHPRIESFRISRVFEPWAVQTEDHYDRFNIRMRLLGLKCQCQACNSQD